MKSSFSLEITKQKGSLPQLKEVIPSLYGNIRIIPPPSRYFLMAFATFSQNLEMPTGLSVLGTAVIYLFPEYMERKDGVHVCF